MNLAKIRPSFSELDQVERVALILEIREHRRYSLETVKKRATRAASSPKASLSEKNASKALNEMTAEQAAQLLALIGNMGEENG